MFCDDITPEVIEKLEKKGFIYEHAILTADSLYCQISFKYHGISFDIYGFRKNSDKSNSITGFVPRALHDKNWKESFDLKELLMLSVATSIDALAAGVTFAFLSVNIFGAVLLIGAVTFILSASGVAIGNRFGIRYKNKAELAGGLALIFMGIKMATDGVLRGLGIMRPFLIANMVNLAIRLSVALICAPRFGIDFVWLAVPAGWLANFLVSYAALRKCWPTEKVELS